MENQPVNRHCGRRTSRCAYILWNQSHLSYLDIYFNMLPNKAIYLRSETDSGDRTQGQKAGLFCGNQCFNFALNRLVWRRTPAPPQSAELKNRLTSVYIFDDLNSVHFCFSALWPISVIKALPATEKKSPSFPMLWAPPAAICAAPVFFARASC